VAHVDETERTRLALRALHVLRETRDPRAIELATVRIESLDELSHPVAGRDRDPARIRVQGIRALATRGVLAVRARRRSRGLEDRLEALGAEHGAVVAAEQRVAIEHALAHLEVV